MSGNETGRMRTAAITSSRAAIAGLTFALVAAGLALYERAQLSQARTEIAAMRRELELVREEVTKARRVEAEANARLAVAEMKSAPTPVDLNANAAGSSMVARITKAKQLLQQMPQWAIPELAFLTDEEWVAALAGLPLETEGQMRWALSEARMAAKKKFSKLLVSALAAYATANGGALPEDLGAVSPYFREAIDPQILNRYTLLKKGDLVAAASLGQSFFADRPDSAVDDAYDTKVDYGTSGWSGGQVNRNASVFHSLIVEYRKANGDRLPGTVDDLRPYVPPPLASFDLSILENFLALEQRPLAP